MAGSKASEAAKDQHGNAGYSEAGGRQALGRGSRGAILELQRSAGNGATEGLLAGGRELPAATRRALQPWVGGDLSFVRVHSGSNANDLVEGFNAVAVTIGRNVFMGDRAGALGSQAGLALLAHEATHALQQRDSHFSGSLVLDPSLNLEQAAQAAGARAAVGAEAISGLPGTVADVGASTSPSISAAVMRADDLPQLTRKQERQWERIKQTLNRHSLTLNDLGFESKEAIRSFLSNDDIGAALNRLETMANAAGESKMSVAREFASRQGLEDPFSYAEEMGQESAGGNTVKSKSWPGNRGQSRASATGVFVHKWADRIILGELAAKSQGAALRSKLELTWPEGVAPNEGTGRIVITLPDGKEYIPDGIDRIKGEIVELKPAGSEAEGEIQARKYAHYMDVEYPLPNGKKWAFRTATYSMKAAQQWLTDDIGVLEAPKGKGQGGASLKAEPVPKAGANPAAAVDEPKKAAEGPEERQRRIPTPAQEALTSNLQDVRARPPDPDAAQRAVRAETRQPPSSARETGGGAKALLPNAELRGRQVDAKLASVARTVGTVLKIGGEIVSAGGLLVDAMEINAMVNRGLISRGQYFTAYQELALQQAQQAENLAKNYELFQQQLVELHAVVLGAISDTFEAGLVAERIGRWLVDYTQLKEDITRVLQSIDSAVQLIPKQKVLAQQIVSERSLGATFSIGASGSSKAIADLMFFLVEADDIRRALSRASRGFHGVVDRLAFDIDLLEAWYRWLNPR